MAKLNWDKAQEGNVIERQGVEYITKEFYIPKGNALHCPHCLKCIIDTEMSQHIALHKHQLPSIKVIKGAAKVTGKSNQTNSSHPNKKIAKNTKSEAKNKEPKILNKEPIEFNTPFKSLKTVLEEGRLKLQRPLKEIKIVPLKNKKT